MQLEEKRLVMSGQAGLHGTANRAARPREYNSIIVSTQLSPGKDRGRIHCPSSAMREGRNEYSIEVIH